MRFENAKVFNFEGAFRGMRNPKESWSLSDSLPINVNGTWLTDDEKKKEYFLQYGVNFNIGEKDLKLAQRLIKAGTEHRKFMRQIFVSVDITVQMLGTADLTAEQEKELISNYNKVIEYNKIQFKGNIKLNSDGVPEVTEDSVDGTNVVELEIKDIINERKIVNEDISFHFERDVTKYPDSVLNDVLNKKEIYAQAECVLFATRVKEALEEKLAEIRALNNKFETETEYTL